MILQDFTKIFFKICQIGKFYACKTVFFSRGLIQEFHEYIYLSYTSRFPLDRLCRSHMQHHCGYCNLEYHWGYFQGILQLLYARYFCHNSCNIPSKYPQWYSNLQYLQRSLWDPRSRSEESGCVINRGMRVPLFSWFPHFWKFYCAIISAFSFIFSLFLAFLPTFTLFFLIFCLWPLTPLN